MRRWLSLLAVFALSTGYAQESGITVNGFLSRDQLAPGQEFRIAVVLELPAPWHCNANPASAPDFIPTTLQFGTNAAVAFGAITYPAGQIEKVTWSDTPVALYSGKTIIFADAKLAGNATGTVTIQGTLRYQACDNQVCYAPKSVPVTLTAPVGAGGALVYAEIFSGTGVPPVVPAKINGPEAHSTNSIAALIQSRGLFLALLAVFLGGLALNLTPCVYPMIAITVSYFGAHTSRTRGQAFAGALAYCLGIIASYSVLGVMAALTGGLFGALLQSEWVLLGISALLVGLALSMFGLFEIRPPSFLVNRAAGMSARAGHVGVFFLGATLGIVAAPCLAPFAVALLAYVGTTRQWWWFLVFACGLAVPYLVLGTFSGLIAQLPKSGTWMVWVKRVFGTALLAVAVWFAWPVLGPATASKSPIAWQPYSAVAIENPGRPVLIDFSADWCIPCREMERGTFRDPRVVAKSKEFLMLKADLTRTGLPEVDRLSEQFQIRGVPTYIFLDSAGREHTDLRRVGLLPAERFLKLMEEAQTPAPTNSEAVPVLPPQLPAPF